MCARQVHVMVAAGLLQLVADRVGEGRVKGFGGAGTPPVWASRASSVGVAGREASLAFDSVNSRLRLQYCQAPVAGLGTPYMFGTVAHGLPFAAVRNSA